MRRERGLTLIELMIVIVIIWLLVGILVPPFTTGPHKIDLTYKCAAHLRALYYGLQEYLNKYGRGFIFPQAKGKNFWLTLRTYPNETKAIYPANNRKFDEFFVCPVTGHIGGPNEIDYRGPANHINLATDSSTPIASDKEENHGHKDRNINILYLDGTVKEKVGPGTPEWINAAKYTVE